ncbi:DUF4158 domain-containing protein [Vibrio parahaemolyticus]|nr:DUF4158 domain-containing protein [Vibrio parahaemolyticus]
MRKVKPSRIQILTEQEVHELYSRPAFNQNEREEFFSIDPSIEKALSNMGKIETKIYLILLIGYFRAKPVVPQFRLRDVKQDVDYIYATHFPNRKPKYPLIAKSTRATLILKMHELLGFKRLTKSAEKALLGFEVQRNESVRLEGYLSVFNGFIITYRFFVICTNIYSN